MSLVESGNNLRSGLQNWYKHLNSKPQIEDPKENSFLNKFLTNKGRFLLQLGDIFPAGLALSILVNMHVSKYDYEENGFGFRKYCEYHNNKIERNNQSYLVVNVVAEDKEKYLRRDLIVKNGFDATSSFGKDSKTPFRGFFSVSYGRPKGKELVLDQGLTIEIVETDLSLNEKERKPKVVASYSFENPCD